MSDGTGAIRLAGIRFARGGRTIFDGLDLTVPLGRSTALVAPSGAGKSTLLALIAGLVDPDGGTVSTPFTPAETGIVLQGYGLAGLLTAAENVEVALQARRGLRRAEIRRRAEEVLEQVHLTAVANHLVEELSGGQQQRVAVARALAVRPRLLIADEFTAELDRGNRDEIADLVFGAAADGTTVVIATHDRRIAERCDVVIPLSDLT
jgi:ABC-type lipoprotein export system ATPase subunit